MIGPPAQGPDGFRETHRRAQATRRCAHADRSITTYGEVALEVLALRDDAEAQAFVARELGPLGEGERGERLRATLRALFVAGSTSGAAVLLGISDRAVAYRVRSVEEAVGDAVYARRTELDTALRLERILDEKQ